MEKKYIICRDIKDKKYKVPVTDLNFRTSVYGLIFKNDKILLSKQWDGYDFPGGGVEKGELIENALKREVWEETGVKVTPGKLLTITEDFFISLETKTPLHSILIYYLCTKPTGRISTRNFDRYEKTYLSAAEWVDVKDTGKIKFYNGVDSPRLIKEAYLAFRGII